MRFYLLFILIWLSSVLAVNTGCNPFYYLEIEEKTTCPGSYIQYMGTIYNIEIISKLIDCETTQKKTANLIFSDPKTGWVLKRRQPEKEYYFEYTIRWEYPDSHCIVDLVPDEESKRDSWVMTDQNGIKNTPFEVINSTIAFFSLF